MSAHRCASAFLGHPDFTMPNAKSTVELEKHERHALAAFRAEAHGIWRASALIGVSRDTYERAAGGLPIRRGSAALIRAALKRLGTAEVLS